MASRFLTCVGLCLLLCASGQGPNCPLHENTAVGSCMIFGCNKARGPTHCSWGSCFCAEGYCKKGGTFSYSADTHCVAYVPDLTCEISGLCQSSGLEASDCEGGLCLCKRGYEVKKGTLMCVPSASPRTHPSSLPATSELAEAVARNATKDEIELLTEHKEHSERTAAQNVAIWTACAAAALVVVASAWALRRRASEPAGYAPLVDC